MGFQSLVLLLCMLYGSVFAIGKMALFYSTPLFITGSRMLLAGGLLLIYQFIFQRKKFQLKKIHLWPIFIIGFTNIYLTNALEFWGLQYLEAGKACFLYSFSPIATAILSYFWFNERMNLQKWAGLAVGILGFLPILIAHSGVENKSGYIGFLSYAELALLGAALSTAIGWLYMRVMVKVQDYSGVMANATTMIVGGVLSIVHSLITDPWNPIPVWDFSSFLLWFGILTLVSNLIAYNLNAGLLKHFTATYLSFAGLSQPFFAAFFGWIFLGEVMNLYFWISLLAVCLGLFIYYKQELKQGLTPKRAKRS